jgi:hypothetical protein
VSDDGLRLTLRRTGGLAGLAMEAELDTAALEPGDAAQVRAAVERALAEPQPVAPATPGPGADRYQYNLVVRRGAERHELTFGEAAVPEALAPLVRRLEGLARPAP